MTSRIDLPTVMFISIITVMLLGAGLAYPLNNNEFNAKVSSDGTNIDITMHSSIQSNYSVCAIDLTNSVKRELIFYYDNTYTSTLEHSKEWENACKMETHLKYLGVPHTTINAEGLKELLLDTANASTKSIVIFSGAFPCNVYTYDGNSIVDNVRSWMEAGGIIYWQSEARFGYYSAPLDENFIDWETNQPLDEGATYFGLSFLGDIEDDKGFGGKIRSNISKILCIEQSMIMNYAVVGNASIENLGFESDDGRYSIAFAKYGSGGAIIMGGDFTPEISMSKIIASQICDWANYSPVIQDGSFKGDYQITMAKGSADAIYVFMGTLTPRYGGLFLL